MRYIECAAQITVIVSDRHFPNRSMRLRLTELEERMKKPSKAPRRGIAILCLLLSAVTTLSLTACNTTFDAENSAAEEAAPVVQQESETTAVSTDPLQFDTPNIPDDGTSEGYISTVDPGVYIYKGMTLELSGASDSAAQDYASAISEFKSACPDVTVYNMVVPVHTEFALPKRIIDSGVNSTSQLQNIKTIYTSYTADVKPINCYNTLNRHSGEYIYFNTDHHWTGLGAYYAYQAFCEQTDQTALDVDVCTEHKIEGFEGSFFDTGSDLTPDTVSYWTLPYETRAACAVESGDEPYNADIFIEGLEGANAYITFIGGDSALFIEYNDNLNSGKKIAVVKESYGNAFVPWLTNNYDEVHVIDSRHFTGSVKDYLSENGITEILFMNNIMSANNPFMVDGIREIF